MKKILYLSAVCLAANLSASTVLLENFETTTAGSIDGQNEWVLLDGTADVQTTVVNSGSRALQLQDGSVTHSLNISTNAIWVNFMARISGAPDADPIVSDSNTSVAFFVNTDLNLVAYSNQTQIILPQQVPTNQWIRFDVYCDYETLTWNLSMEGTTVAAGLPLFSDNREIESVLIANNSPHAIYLDNLDIADTEQVSASTPDLDTDGIPDWWEQKYTGSLTAAITNSASANGSLTLLQTYIAGVSPDGFDPFITTAVGPNGLSWNSMPGREYDILWTPDLKTDFLTVATVTDAGEYFDETTRTLEPSGFYKLRARMQ